MKTLAIIVTAFLTSCSGIVYRGQYADYYIIPKARIIDSLK